MPGMTNISFSIADAHFTVTANYDPTDQLFIPQAYNLHHNFKIAPADDAPSNHRILLEDTDTTPEIYIGNDGLHVRGRIATETGSAMERQNSLWGINGPVNKYIMHILETIYHTVTLHASAVVDATNSKVCLAVGHSGSGKSVFVVGALKAGWQLLASEYVLVRLSEDRLHIYTGNYLDNMSAKAIEETRTKLPQAPVLKDKFIQDLLTHKVLVDLSPYQTIKSGVSIPPAALTVAILNIHSPLHKGGSPIHDAYFFNRVLQQIATEKIAMPLIMNRQMIDTVPSGSVAVRSAVIKAIAAQAANKIILGGGVDDFDAWLAANV